MATDDKREQLVHFLDEKVFDPVLKATESRYDESQKRKLSDVKRSTESEKRRFHDTYRTAKAVKSNYLSDLNSEIAKRKNKELEELGLPRMYQVREEFLKLCERLHV
jgi:hypothetical protein